MNKNTELTLIECRTRIVEALIKQRQGSLSIDKILEEATEVFDAINGQSRQSESKGISDIECPEYVVELTKWTDGSVRGFSIEYPQGTAANVILVDGAKTKDFLIERFWFEVAHNPINGRGILRFKTQNWSVDPKSVFAQPFIKPSGSPAK